MASYSIEDIEFIRRKASITYEEAVALLDYHNGDVARALVDLERNGKVNAHTEAQSSAKVQTRSGNAKKGGLMSFLQRLYRTRVKVNKGNTAILNLSVLFMTLSIIISPHLAIIGLILALVLGYRISIDTDDEAFRADDLESMVKSAAGNVKQNMNNIAREISRQAEEISNRDRKLREEAAAPKAETEVKSNTVEVDFTRGKGQNEESKAEAPLTDASFYMNGPATFSHDAAFNPEANVPTLQMPVKVDSADGNVSFEQDQNGYGTVTVE